MRYQLLRLREAFYLNVWFFPSICTLIFLGLSLLLTNPMFHTFDVWFIGTFLHIDPQSAGIILSTLAGSVITITSVVFSITVLTLSMAASQLGPRILPNFMRQGKTQLVLGIFVGTFIYCIFTLRAVGEHDLPTIAIILGLFMGVLSFFSLIYFINFVISAIQIDNILDYLSSEIKSAINREFEHIDATKNPKRITRQEKDENSDDPFKGLKKHAVKANHSGYIQSLDYANILNISVKEDIYVDIHHRAGQYIVEKMALMDVYSEKPIKDSVQNKLLREMKMGDQRTIIQDVEFGFEQIVEIGVRAMSPGINEPFTAVHCLNILGESIIYLNEFRIPDEQIKDDTGVVRVIYNQTSYHSIVDTTFERFRQQAIFDMTVGIRLLAVIENTLEFKLIKPLKKELICQARLLYEDMMALNINDEDKKDVQARFEGIMEKASTP